VATRRCLFQQVFVECVCAFVIWKIVITGSLFLICCILDLFIFTQRSHGVKKNLEAQLHAVSVRQLFRCIHRVKRVAPASYPRGFWVRMLPGDRLL
jgi:hypothetical protein